jgi:hypothetical protein
MLRKNKLINDIKLRKKYIYIYIYILGIGSLIPKTMEFSSQNGVLGLLRKKK